MILHLPITHPIPGYRLLLFDADGTLRETVVEGARQPRPPNLPSEWQLLPHVQEVLSCYEWGLVQCAIVSNQGGVALGYITEADAHRLLYDTLVRATLSVCTHQQIWLCPHAPQAGCMCRKPQPMLLLMAICGWQRWAQEAGRLRSVLPEVLYIGDQDSDRDAAAAAGIDFCWARDFFGWREASACHA